MYSYLWALIATCLFFSPCLAQETGKKGGSNDGDDAKPGPMVVLGTVQAEIIRVSDGGSKLVIRFKEVVESTRRNSTGFKTSKIRLPSFKEKTQEVDIRVYARTTIRLVNAGPDGKGAEAAKESAMENEDADNKPKNEKKPAKTSKEKNLPGKKGERKDLTKGQVVIMTIAEEQAAGFTRYVATSIYVLGEK